MSFTFTPDLIDYAVEGDNLAAGAIKINANFEAIASGGTLTGTGGEALGQYILVYSKLSDSGKFYVADANGTDEEQDAVGITLDAISEDGTGTIQLGNSVVTNAAWSWNYMVPLFLGEDGAITTNPSALLVTKPIGFAKSATQILFMPTIGWYNGAWLDVYADQLGIAYIPTNYTRTLTPEVNAIDQLTAHIKGLDDAIASLISRVGALE